MEMGNSKEEFSPPTKKLGVRHVQCLLLFLGMALGYGLRVCMSVAIVAMKNAKDANPNFPEHKWDQTTSGFVLTSFFWGYIITQVPSGQLATTMSAQKLLACGIFLSSALNTLVPFLANYGVVAVISCRVAMGLFQGCLMPCTQTLLSRWVPLIERNRLGSFVMNGAQFGTVVTMPISGILTTSSIGWPSIFYIFGLAGIVWSVIFYCMGADRPSDHPSICFREVHYINGSLGNLNKVSSNQKPKVPWQSILTSVPMWALIIVHCGNDWGFYTLLNEMPTYMKNVLKFDTSKSGVIAALPYLTMWLLGFPISFFAEFVQRKGVSLGIVRKVCNSIGLWVPAAAMIVLSVVTTTNTTILVAILVVAVGFNSGIYCGFKLNHIDLSPNFAGPMMSVTNFFANVLGIIAPVLCGAITNKNEHDPILWHIVFYITAAFYIISNLIFVIFGKAVIQSWNESEDGPTVPRRGRHSVISIIGEPTSLSLPE